MRIFGVVLAGGQARRMGGADKALLPLAGRPLLAHVLARLAPQVDRVVISANGDAARFAGFGCDVVADEKPQGPLSGVLAGMLHAAARGASHVVTTPVDTPFLPQDMVARLVAAAQGGFAVAVADRDHPACAVWPVSLAPALSDYLAEGEAKVTRFALLHGAARACFPDARAFQNLNSPEDMARAEALLTGAA